LGGFNTVLDAVTDSRLDEPDARQTTECCVRKTTTYPTQVDSKSPCLALLELRRMHVVVRRDSLHSAIDSDAQTPESQYAVGGEGHTT